MTARSIIFSCLLSLLFSLPTKAAETPVRVVVSIAPIHSLATAVMEGVAEPVLLVKSGASPHSVMMKPSQMRRLQSTDLVLWVGDNLEGYLPRVLSGLPESVGVMALMDLPGLTRLAARHGGDWQGHDHDHHATEHGHHGHADYDGHIWLDPDNAKTIVRALVERLKQIDPQNAARYQRNAEALVSRLTDLDKSLTAQLATVKEKPYVVFHDAYHALEDRYGLNAVGAVSVDPERKPSAKRLREIRRLLKQQAVVCVFSEPQYSRSVVDAVTEGLTVKVAELDPMGQGLSLGSSMYFRLMERLAHQLLSCLD